MEVFKIGVRLFKICLQISRIYEQNKPSAVISTLADLKKYHLELTNIPLQNLSCITSAGWLQDGFTRALSTEDDQVLGAFLWGVGGRAENPVSNDSHETCC